MELRSAYRTTLLLTETKKVNGLMDNEPHANFATPEEICYILREVLKKTLKNQTRTAEKLRKEADRRMKKLEGLFINQWGTLMESLVEGDPEILLQARGIEVQSTNVSG